MSFIILHYVFVLLCVHSRSEVENTEEEDPEKQVEDGQTVRTLHARPHTRCTDTKRGAGFCVEQAFYIVLY